MALKIRVCKTNNWLKDNGYTLQEEIEIYKRQLQDIIDNPRWYLDNLEYLVTYRVRWKNYRNNKPTLIPKQKDL